MTTLKGHPDVPAGTALNVRLIWDVPLQGAGRGLSPKHRDATYDWSTGKYMDGQTELTFPHPRAGQNDNALRGPLVAVYTIGTGPLSQTARYPLQAYETAPDELDITVDPNPATVVAAQTLIDLITGADVARTQAEEAAQRVTDAILDLEAERQAVADIIASTAQAQATNNTQQASNNTSTTQALAVLPAQVAAATNALVSPLTGRVNAAVAGADQAAAQVMALTDLDGRAPTPAALPAPTPGAAYLVESTATVWRVNTQGQWQDTRFGLVTTTTPATPLYLYTTHTSEYYPDATQTEALIIWGSTQGGSEWQQLTGPLYNPVNKSLRDPNILYRNGRYYIAHSRGSLASGSPVPEPDISLIVSDDLLTWVPLVESLLHAAGAQVWAPKWHVDAAGDVWVLYYNKLDTNPNTYQHWVRKALNAELTQWSAPQQLQGTDPLALDPFIIRRDDGAYYCFASKNLGGTQTTTVYKSTSGMLGPYTFLKDDTTLGWGRGEGPTILRMPDGRYRCFVDNLGANFYYSDSWDLETWSAITDTNSLIHHGGPLMATDYKAVRDVMALTLHGLGRNQRETRINLGARTLATGVDTVAFGNQASSTQDYSVTIGSRAKVNAGQGGVAIGRDSLAAGNFTLAAGWGAKANAAFSVALGFVANDGSGTVAGDSSVAVGRATRATGAQSVAVGKGALGSGAGAVGIGDTANASADGAISIGKLTTAAKNATVMGYRASGNLEDVVVIGRDAAAVSIGGVVIGAAAVSSLAAGESSSAAGTTIGQGATTINAGLGATAVGRAATARDAGVALGANSRANAVGSTALGAFTNDGITGGVNSTALGYLARAAGAQGVAVGKSSQAGGSGSVALGDAATAAGTDAIAAGRISSAAGQDSVALGRAATVPSQDAVAIGRQSTATDVGAVALGVSSNATTAGTAVGSNARANPAAGSSGGTAIGASAVATGQSSTAVGQSSRADATGATALGSITNNGVTAGVNSVCVGNQSKASASDSTALGKGANAAHARSTALGGGSATTAVDQVMLGTGTQTVVHPGQTDLAGSAVLAAAGAASTHKITIKVAGATYYLLASNA